MNITFWLVLILAAASLLAWLAWKGIQGGKKAQNVMIRNPTVRNGHWYIIDPSLPGGGGECVGGERIDDYRIKCLLQTTSGETTKDYVVSEIDANTFKAANLFGNSQLKYRVYGAGEEHSDVVNENRKLVAELAFLRQEVELLKANSDVLSDKRVEEIDKIVRGSKEGNAYNAYNRGGGQ